jgi:hypothetical protein
VKIKRSAGHARRLRRIGDFDEQRDQCLVKARRRKPCEAFDFDALTEFNLKRYKLYNGVVEITEEYLRRKEDAVFEAAFAEVGL